MSYYTGERPSFFRAEMLARLPVDVLTCVRLCLCVRIYFGEVQLSGLGEGNTRLKLLGTVLM